MHVTTPITTLQLKVALDPSVALTDVGVLVNSGTAIQEKTTHIEYSYWILLVMLASASIGYCNVSIYNTLHLLHSSHTLLTLAVTA